MSAYITNNLNARASAATHSVFAAVISRYEKEQKMLSGFASKLNLIESDMVGINEMKADVLNKIRAELDPSKKYMKPEAILDSSISSGHR